MFHGLQQQLTGYIPDKKKSTSGEINTEGRWE